MPTVNDLLDRKASAEVFGVRVSTPATDAAAMLRKNKIGILVCRDEDGAMVGVLSERDFVRAVAERAGEIADLTAVDLITRDVETCIATDDLERVVRRMGAGGFRHMPVVDGKQVIGLISVTDIFRYYCDYKPDRQLDILTAYSTMSLS